VKRRNVVEEEEGHEGAKRRDKGKQGRKGVNRVHKGYRGRMWIREE
jgi:hypothetical protein